MALFGKEKPVSMEELEARIKDLESKNLDLEIERDDVKKLLVAKGIKADLEAAVENEDGTYDYRIDLPPSGGMQLTINGVQYFHGQSYRFDVNQLRTVQEMVHRSWSHEESIMGNNENAYRPVMNTVLSMRGRRAS